jgi:branched-chain amino acid transport system ATP-binding protein
MSESDALSALGVCKRFGGVVAAGDLDLHVCRHAVHGLVGPNGAGKTTVLNILSGVTRADSGRILVNGHDVTRSPPHRIARFGLARTFQNVKLFGRMSTFDHVLVACDHLRSAGIWRQLFHTPRDRADRRAATGRTEEALALVGLLDRRDEPASALSYGDQRRLEIARALATDASILLLDEPTAGMNELESDRLGSMLAELRSHTDLTILVVEHNVDFVRRYCDRLTVMSFGRVIAEGLPNECLDSAAVKEAYFGRRDTASSDEPASPRSLISVPSMTAPDAVTGTDVVLSVSGLSAAYGPIPAIHDIDCEVLRGELVALIGANGAGKSTTLNTVMGVVRQRAGRIVFGSESIDTWSPTKRVRHGLNIVPEGRRVLAPLTVEENLRLARLARRDGVEDAIAFVYDLFPRLADRRRQQAGSLSGGEQQMLALGRALATSPSLLLLDEPSMGLAPAIVDIVMDAIRTLQREGLTMLLVEQNGPLALSIADKAYVLHRGTVALHGTAEEVQADRALLTAYLGAEATANVASDDRDAGAPRGGRTSSNA